MEIKASIGQFSIEKIDDNGNSLALTKKGEGFIDISWLVQHTAGKLRKTSTWIFTMMSGKTYIDDENQHNWYLSCR